MLHGVSCDNLTGQQENYGTRFPYGLVVRIPAFHVGGPGSIPGVGICIFMWSQIAL